MENFILHKAQTRGFVDQGWLQNFYTFSFAHYYNPERMNFGVLKVLNEDIVAGGAGFELHPHNDIEIISILLEGDIEYKDNLGTSVIHNHDVQAISAGSGIWHSVFNSNKDKPLKLLQIRIMPNKLGVAPRNSRITLKKKDRKNKFQQFLSPNANDNGLWIYQNTWFFMCDLEKGKSVEYTMKSPENGLYVFLINGDLLINEQELNKRDGYGIWNISAIKLEAIHNSEVLLMEVPMTNDGSINR